MDEDFRFHNHQVDFKPVGNTNADTSIFKPGTRDLNVRIVHLPKSNIDSYNLYDIKTMKVNKALKHNVDMQGQPVQWNQDGNGMSSSSIDYFIRRSALEIKHLIGNSSIDIVTYPQSSSNFNNMMCKAILSYFPNSEGIRLIPELLSKNIKNIYVNVNIAKSLGLSDSEIHDLQRWVEKWHKDEDIRSLRREVQVLQNEVANMIQSKTEKRGRPSKEITNRRDKIDYLNQQIKDLRKGVRGKDPTIDKETGEVRNWQIKSLDDKWRSAIEGIFTINPLYQQYQYKLQGKTVLVFDDNISSGATMDDVCLALKKLGVGKIIPITLGVIPSTIYGAHERINKHVQ